MPTLAAFLRALRKEWIRDNTMQHAAAIAYYAIFSLPPLLLFLLSIAGFIAGNGMARAEIFRTIDYFLGGILADVLKTIVQDISSPDRSTAMIILSFVFLCTGGSGFFRSLRGSLDIIIRLPPRACRGWSHRLYGVVLPFLLLMASAALILVSLAAHAVMSVFSERIDLLSRLPSIVFVTSDFLFSYLAIIGILFGLYQVLPSARLPMIPSPASACCTAAAFIVLRSLFSLYIGAAHVGKAYGIASSTIMLLLWIYISAVLFLLGAEMIKVWVSLTDSRAERKKRWVLTKK